MKTLDVEALLEKNPKVDRKEIRRRASRDKESPRFAPPVSPYAGRRLIADERIDLDDGRTKRVRTYYATF